MALAQRAASGDQAAFAALVFRHERGLRAFLSRLVGSDAAADLAQETFLRAWQRAGRFSARGSYAGWLYRIGWNLALDRIRQNKRRLRREQADPTAPHAAQPQAPAMIEAERLLARLDPRSRAALVLCDGHGWSHAEASTMLGLPLGTTKSLIARAKAQLRAVLEEGET